MFSTDGTDIRVPSIIPVEFWQESDQLPDGTFITVDFVKWIKKGNPNHGGSDKVSRIKKYDSSLWSAIDPHYKAWKDKIDAPLNGTSIDVFPAVSPKMAIVLKTNGFMTIEDLAESTDADFGRIGMGAVSLRDKARAYVKMKGGDGKTAAQIVNLQNEIDILKQQNEELNAYLKSLKLNEQKAPEPTETKRRGRPRRDITDDTTNDAV